MIRDILTAHFERYPLMEPQDAVKLIYQAVFGPGHLIKSPDKALERIREEMRGLEERPGEPLYEAVGGGLCRLNLRGCRERGITPEEILPMLLEAAGKNKGTEKQMKEGLKTLRDLTEQGEAPFDEGALETFLLPYEDRGYPMVRHSDAYRAAYAPAYRIVPQKRLKDYLKNKREQSLQKS